MSKDIQTSVSEALKALGIPEPTDWAAIPPNLIDQVPGRKSDCTEETQEPEESQETEETNELKEREESKEAEELEEIDELHQYTWEKINRAISACVVGSDKMVNGPLFELARAVRGCEEEVGKRFSLAILHQIIERWQATNRDHLHVDHDYLVEFLDKLSLVRFPAGRVLVNALEVAQKQPPPKKTETLSLGVQLLASLCRELQRQAGTEPFFLDGRSAAKLIGKPHETVASWLRALHHLGVIRLVQRGQRGFASRYRYIAAD